LYNVHAIVNPSTKMFLNFPIEIIKSEYVTFHPSLFFLYCEVKKNKNQQQKY